MAYFTAYVRTNVSQSRIEESFEVPDDEIEGLSENERDEVITSYAEDAIAPYWDWGWTDATA